MVNGELGIGADAQHQLGSFLEADLQVAKTPRNEEDV